MSEISNPSERLKAQPVWRSSGLKLDLKKDPRTNLRRLAEEISRNLDKQASRLPQDPEEAIHELRVGVKRLRGLMQLVRLSLPKGFRKRQDKKLSLAARGLSTSRDQSVLLGLLEQMSVKAASARCRKASGRLLDRMRQEAPPESLDLATLRKAANKLVKDVRSLSQDTRRLGKSAPETGEWALMFQELYRRARKTGRRALESGNDEALHDWRKRVKPVYYAFQMLSDRKVPKRYAVERWRRFQTALGDDHDLHLLELHLHHLGFQPENATQVRAILPEIRNRRRALQSSMRTLSEELLGRSSGRFAKDCLKVWKS